MKIFFYLKKETKTLEIILDEYKNEKINIENNTIQWWSIQILKGLDFLHKNEMIHHNIKPKYYKNNNFKNLIF